MRKKVVLVGCIVLILLLIVNLVNYLKIDHIQNMNIQLNKDNVNEVDYLYSIKGINSLNFTFEYINNQDTIQDKLGSYYFGNEFDVKNIDIFNIFSQIMGKISDSGHIKLSILEEDNCIYLDCFSNSNKSKAMTISKLNLIENKSFKEYKIDYTMVKEDENTIILFEGFSIKDASRIRLVASYE